MFFRAFFFFKDFHHEQKKKKKNFLSFRENEREREKREDIIFDWVAYCRLSLLVQMINWSASEEEREEEKLILTFCVLFRLDISILSFSFISNKSKDQKEGEVLLFFFCERRFLFREDDDDDNNEGEDIDIGFPYAFRPLQSLWLVDP